MFHRNKGRPDGLSIQCKPCAITAVADSKIFTQYGITRQRANEMLEKQGGLCLLCDRPISWGKKESGQRDSSSAHIDHSHETGAVRGILCARCNHGLGQFFDDPSLLERAALYLRMGRSAHEVSLSRNGPGVTRWRWACSCGVKSIWYPTLGQRDDAVAEHAKQ